MKENYFDEDIIDIELASKNETFPPKGKKYRFKVDENLYLTTKEILTGSEILNITNKNPNQWILRQKIKGKWFTVQPNEAVDFTTAGVEKFKTLPTDQIDGEIVKSPKRDFTLLEEDEEFLESLDFIWETINDNVNPSLKWILIHDYPIVKGYNVTKAKLAINMAAGYPVAQLDMIFFNPPIYRLDGLPIPNTTLLLINGNEFQQWSRHRSEQNKWRPGIDNLSTHYPLAEIWLRNEFLKRPSNAISV